MKEYEYNRTINALISHVTVIDKGTFTDSAHYPGGIEYVMVNGEFEVRKGEYTGIRNGAVLRKKGIEVSK